MEFRPPRALGLALGALFALALLTLIAASIAQLGSTAISALSLVWIVSLLVAVPVLVLVLNRVHGLLTARYRFDRDGFYVEWGLASEQVPIHSLRAIHTDDELGFRPRPDFGFWWPGCRVGRTEVEGSGELALFATTGPQLILETAPDRGIVVTPGDEQAFRAAYLSATRLGSLETIPQRIERPDFVVTQMWGDRAARGLILAGLAQPLLLLTLLVVGAGRLPEEIRFGIGGSGEPVSSARLLLLPMIGALIWVADLVVGAWFYGRDRPVSYALWGVAVLSGVLLGGAALQLLVLSTGSG